MNSRIEDGALDGVYKYMSDAYRGNNEYRWAKTPYMEHLPAQENLLAHQWSCVRLAALLKDTCPALQKVISWAEVYERLMSHDDGETQHGDISATLQLRGHGTDKVAAERLAITEMAKGMTESTRQKLIDQFDAFEQPAEKISRPEVLFAKFIDHLQGNHFALIFGNDLSAHSELISKIVNKHFVPYALRLIDVLRSGDHTEAATEIEEIFRHHIKQIQKAGIILDTSGFENLLMR